MPFKNLTHDQYKLFQYLKEVHEEIMRVEEERTQKSVN